MSNKSVLCIYGGNEYEAATLATAFALARASHAALRVLHLERPPEIYPDTPNLAGFAASAYGDAIAIDILEQAETERTDAARKAVALQAHAAGIPMVSDGAPSRPGQAHAAFRAQRGDLENIISYEGRSVDVVVTALDTHSSTGMASLLTGLFQTSSPVLAVPKTGEPTIAQTGYAKTVVVAWDGSLAAARALREAVPYMLHATQVLVLNAFRDAPTPDAVAYAQDVVAYLESHSIAAEWLHEPCGTRSVAETLLERAQYLGADLIVMGAYGKGHVVEMLLGGTTDHVIKHTTIPLLLAR
jgi:nucleotide-binding universal stress UspA family protein